MNIETTFAHESGLLNEEMRIPEERVDSCLFVSEECESKGIIDDNISDLQKSPELMPTVLPERNRNLRVVGVYPQEEYITPGSERERIEPLGFNYVLTQAVNRGYPTELLTLFGKDEDELIDELVRKRPDIIPISAMTCQMPKGLIIAEKIKQKLPNSKVIFGGYHPSAISDSTTPELISSKAVDYWVRGEGEQTFADILDTLERGKDPIKEEIPGLIFQKNGQIISIKRPRVIDLDSFGRVWRQKELVQSLRNRALTYPAPSEQTGLVAIDHSRGCLGHCSFCASPEVLGSIVTFRSPEKVSQEMKALYYDFGINTFFFTDLDFIQRTSEQQQKVSELCKRLKDLNLPIYWECAGRLRSVLATDNYKLLSEMYEAGCRKITWGLESIDPDILKSMNKGHKGEQDSGVFDVLAKAEEVGILNTAFYIIGWHDFETGIGDSRETIRRDLELLLKYPIHRLRITFGTPLPGSRFYDTCKRHNKLVDGQLEHYDTQHLVYQHPSLSSDELASLRSEIYTKFYSSPQYNERVSSMIRNHPEYKNTFQEFLTELQHQS